MKALVTGGCGFIGSHLAERLRADGHDVKVFDLYTSERSHGWLAGKDFDITLGDIRDRSQVERACEGMDVVFHLAALIDVPHSYVAPESYIQTNVLGTLNVLEGAKRHGVSRVVHTSTSEVYGTPATLPIRESHPLQAQSPYAASKIAADQLALSYHRSFGLPVTVLRPFNTYGPRQSTRAVLPSMLTQLLLGKSEIRLGRTDTRRDMTYVSDTVEGFVRAGTKPNVEGEVIHLGTGIDPTVAELFALAKRVVYPAWISSAATIVQDEKLLRPETSEVLVLRSDPHKAGALLGWAPVVDLRDGLRLTAEWMLYHGKREAA